MLKKWFEIIFDHRLRLRERMFRVVTGVCMLALIFILPMGRSLFNILVLAVSLAVIGLVVRASIKKECIHAGATFISILLLLLFPLSFFTAGGFYSGMPEWFVLCFVYISITLEGRRKGVFFLLSAAGCNQYTGKFFLWFRRFCDYGGCADQRYADVFKQAL